MKIREFRIKMGFTQTELAIKIGITKGYLNEIERGKKIPSIPILEQLAYVLDVCPCMILEFKCKNH